MSGSINEKNALLEHAMFQLRMLRRENELMGARLEVFDTLTAFLRARAPERGAMLSEDLAYSIELHLKTEQDLKRKQPEPPGTASHAPPANEGYETGD